MQCNKEYQMEHETISAIERHQLAIETLYQSIIERQLSGKGLMFVNSGTFAGIKKQTDSHSFSNSEWFNQLEKMVLTGKLNVVIKMRTRTQSGDKTKNPNKKYKYYFMPDQDRKAVEDMDENEIKKLLWQNQN